MHRLLPDLKAASRQMRTNPLFSSMVIGMLAFGIAGNAAIFSVFNALFLRSLPFEESNRLVELDETAPKWNLPYVGVATPDFDQWQKSNSTFESMAFFTGASYNLSQGITVERVQAAQVTRDMLAVLRLKPAIGRDFRLEDDRPGAAKVALLSYNLWQGMFYGDLQVLGRVIKLGEQPCEIIGVLPRAAVFPDGALLWVPLAADTSRPSGYFLNGVGRLKPGVTLVQARADLLRIHRGMISAGRSVNAITSPTVTPIRDRYLGNFQVVSRVLLLAVGMVLLIACVNIGALTMARSSSRAREIAIRNAIGASSRRIATQLLTESLALAACGAAAGIPLGAALLRVLVARMPAQLPGWITFSLDWRSIAFCALLTGLAALVFGLAPVVEASHLDIREALQNAAARFTATRERAALLRSFVIGEVALAVILSVGAGLLVEAFEKVMRTDPGFRPGGVLTFGIALPDIGYEIGEQKVAYYDNLLSKLRALPGVTSVGAASSPPLGPRWGGQFEAEGAPITRQGENPVVLRVAVTPGYFAAVGNTLVAGRTFNERDSGINSPLVAMVNETFAKHLWRGANPVGKRIRYPGGKEWYQVIGLLRDERHDGLDQDVPATVYLPYPTALAKSAKDDLRSLRLMTIVLRASSNPEALATQAREIVRQVDPDVPMYDVQTMDSRVEQALWTRRAYSSLFMVFAIAALVMAAAGVYGTVAYSVSQRTQEIAIRMAIGARPGQVLGQIVREGMGLIWIGVAAGLAGALWGSTLLRALLFDVSSGDPVIYASVAIGAVAIGLAANLIPAHGAAVVDPVQAIRS